MTEETTPATSKMIKADFISALFFLALGGYMVLESLKMPGAGGFIEIGGEPGRVPVMIGAFLMLLSTVLLVRSSLLDGWKVWELAELDESERVGAMRTAFTAIGCSFYAVGLIGASIAGWDVPYYHATALFMFVFIVGFEWQQVDAGSARLRLIIMALLQAIIVTSLVTYLFEQKFYVVLP